MRIYKTKPFGRFARKSKISDGRLREAVSDAGKGIIDADLGGGLIKLRIARENEGKRGGFRALAGFKTGNVAIFITGFAKKDQDNIADDEVEDLKTIARIWLDDPKKIETDLRAGSLIEVKNDDDQG